MPWHASEGKARAPCVNAHTRIPQARPLQCEQGDKERRVRSMVDGMIVCAVSTRKRFDPEDTVAWICLLGLPRSILPPQALDHQIVSLTVSCLPSSLCVSSGSEVHSFVHFIRSSPSFPCSFVPF